MKMRMPASPMENEMLKMLKRVLDRYEINPDSYCFNDSAEQRVCLEKTRWFWNCFNVEKGIEFQVKSFCNLEDACMYFIERISNSQKEVDILSREFKAELHKIRS